MACPSSTCLFFCLFFVADGVEGRFGLPNNEPRKGEGEDDLEDEDEGVGLKGDHGGREKGC